MITEKVEMRLMYKKRSMMKMVKTTLKKKTTPRKQVNKTSTVQRKPVMKKTDMDILVGERNLKITKMKTLRNTKKVKMNIKKVRTMKIMNITGYT